MADPINKAAPFAPLLSAAEVGDNLSAQSCANRDVMRRTAAMVLTNTPAELVEAAKSDPETAAIVSEIVSDIAEHVRVEAEMYEAALHRVLWAACEAGIAPLAEDVEGPDHG